MLELEEEEELELEEELEDEPEEELDDDDELLELLELLDEDPELEELLPDPLEFPYPFSSAVKTVSV